MKTIIKLSLSVILVLTININESLGQNDYRCNNPLGSYILSNYEEPADLYNYMKKGLIKFSPFNVMEGERASITITNVHERACPLPISLASYKMYGDRPEDLIKYKETKVNIPPSQSRTIEVGLPDCMAEIGIYLVNPEKEDYGAPETQEGRVYMSSLIGWTYQMNSKDLPEENDMLHGWGEFDRYPNEYENKGESIAGLHERLENDDSDDGPRNSSPSTSYCEK